MIRKFYVSQRTLASLAVLAAQAIPASAQEGSEPPNLVLTSLKSLGVLLLVLALIILAAWAAKKYLRFLPQGGVRSESIKILAVRALGPKRSVHLIEVEGKKVLLGSSEGGVTLLKELPDMDSEKLENPHR